MIRHLFPWWTVDLALFICSTENSLFANETFDINNETCIWLKIDNNQQRNYHKNSILPADKTTRSDPHFSHLYPHQSASFTFLVFSQKSPLFAIVFPQLFHVIYSSAAALCALTLTNSIVAYEWGKKLKSIFYLHKDFSCFFASPQPMVSFKATHSQWKITQKCSL